LPESIITITTTLADERICVAEDTLPTPINPELIFVFDNTP